MLIVLGGQSKHVGKTTAVCAIISAFADMQWTAIKITPHQHEEEDGETDTARYLAAGAINALLLKLDDRVSLQEQLTGSKNIILESNSVMEFVNPDLFLFVISPRAKDFKPSAHRFLHRVDAFLCFESQPDNVFLSKPVFPLGLGEPLPHELVTLISGVASTR